MKNFFNQKNHNDPRFDEIIRERDRQLVSLYQPIGQDEDTEIRDHIDHALTIDPEITMFKNVARTHTKFRKTNKMVFESNNINFSETFHIPIPHFPGFDMIQKFSIIIKLPDLDKEITYVKDIRDTILRSVKMSVVSDTHEIINNDILHIQKLYSSDHNPMDNNNHFMIDLPFFHTSTQNHFFPYCAIKDEMILSITTEDYANCCTGIEQSDTPCISCKVYASYMQISPTERARFCKEKNRYLLNKFEYLTIDFKHPYKNDIMSWHEFAKCRRISSDLKEIVLSFIVPKFVDIETEFNLGTGIKDFHFAFRFPRRSDRYFNYQAVSIHTLIKNNDNMVLDNDVDYFTKISHTEYNVHIDNLYSHSFAIDTRKYQPTGEENLDTGCMMINTISTKKMMMYGTECQLVIMYSKYDVLETDNGKYRKAVHFRKQYAY